MTKEAAIKAREEVKALYSRPTKSHGFDWCLDEMYRRGYESARDKRTANLEGSFFDFVEQMRGEFVLALAKGDFYGGFNRAMDRARQWGHNRAEEMKQGGE